MSKLAAPVVVAGVVTATALPATAAGPVTSTPQAPWGVALTFSGTTKATNVYSVVRTPDRIYLGGDFDRLNSNTDASQTRPAVDLAALTPDGQPDAAFNGHVSTDGLIRRVVFAPDGSVPGAGRLYVGGTFKTVTVDGVKYARSRVARLLVTRGAAPVMDTSWAPSLTGSQTGWKETDPSTHAGTTVQRPTVVYAIAVGNGRVYVGGTFSAANGSPRTDAAAFDETTGTLDTGWNPTADNGSSTTTTSPTSPGDIHGPSVRHILVDASRSRVYLAGEFDAVDGNNTYKGVAGVTPDTGALVPSFRISNNDNDNDAFDLSFGSWKTNSSVLLVAGAGVHNDLKVVYPDQVKPTIASVATDGDVQTLAVQGDYVYLGGHFREVGKFDTAYDESRTVRVRLSTGLLDTAWKPQLTSLQNTYYYGVWSITTYHDDATNKDYVYMGGVFKDAKPSPSGVAVAQKKFTWFEA